MPKFWVVNEGVENGVWGIYLKVLTGPYSTITFGGKISDLAKANVRLDIYCHQAENKTKAGAEFLRRIAEEFMSTPEFQAALAGEVTLLESNIDKDDESE